MTINRAGFKKRIQTGEVRQDIEFFVFPEVFRTEVCAGLDASLVARELVRLGYTKPSKDDKPSVTQRLPGMPDPIRVYHFTSAILGSESE